MLRDNRGTSSAWVANEQPGKEFCLVDLAIRENYVWCLVIVVMTVGLTGAKGLREEGFKVIFCGRGQTTKRKYYLGEYHEGDSHYVILLF